MLDIGLEIRILRERLKVPAKELAQRVGLSQSQMSRLEKGQRRIDTQVLHRIAEVLGVDPSHFFRGTEAPESGVIAAALPQSIGRRLRSERRKRHISAEELASRVGRSKAVIQSIEEGKRPLDPQLAEAILKALRLPAGFVFTAQGEVIQGLEAQVARLGEALAAQGRGTLDLGSTEPALSPDDGDADDSEDGEVQGASKHGRIRRAGIPVLGNLTDGYPQTFDAAGRPVAEPEDFLYVPDIEAPDAFALHVVGDSMAAASTPSFCEGELLVLARQPLRSRDFAFVRLRHEPPVFRQVFFEPKGQMRLQPLNLSYAALICTREAILESWRLVAHVRRLA